MDQVLYLEVLGALAVMTLLFFVQTKALRGDPSWIGWVLDIGWFFLLLGFFVWAPRLLLHESCRRTRHPSRAVFTMICLVGLRLISGLLLKHWLEWYSRTYGALGIVMAIFFWIIVRARSSSLPRRSRPRSPHRRDLRHARLARPRNRRRPVSEPAVCPSRAKGQGRPTAEPGRAPDDEVPARAAQAAHGSERDRDRDALVVVGGGVALPPARPQGVPEHLDRAVVRAPDGDHGRLRRRHPDARSGKLVASFVMLEGIAFVAIITAAVTSAFVARAQEARSRAGAEAAEEELEGLEAQVAELTRRFDDFEALLRRSRDA